MFFFIDSNFLPIRVENCFVITGNGFIFFGGLLVLHLGSHQLQFRMQDKQLPIFLLDDQHNVACNFSGIDYIY